ncbi:protein PET100 homolog, mitochondrial isoform X1 [Phyllopteryx taeniolatus]|uniref:protein PET100 homolog, mitochondrial isoform X1 n=1 Tax=Phyllopteryx taeniolatus TaxID=161469 RepID=UPI002AD2A219|nr:protein PET100 homolog, mitochondrial isoform X1 [Phyllopteryx taeniolatus]
MAFTWVYQVARARGLFLSEDREHLSWSVTSHMMLYLSFPVTMFWISNQAEYFEEYIVKRKREIFPADERLNRKELEDFKERMRTRKEQRELKQICMESEN